MAVYLNWANPNTGGETAIFRSASPIDQANPGTPIVTFNDNTSSYADDVPLFGDTVYYLIRSVAGGETIFSREVKTVVGSDTGPGPQELMWGDMNFGYFGRIIEQDLGIMINRWGTPGTDRYYHKLMRKGKILYVPLPLFGTSKSANSLIGEKNFNTGITSAFDTGPSTGGAVVTIKGRKFAPRIAKFYDDDNADLQATNYSVYLNKGMPMGKSEFVDILRIFWSEASPAAASRTLVAAPFKLNQSLFPSGSGTPFITSDFTTAGKGQVVGFNVIQVDAIAIGAIGVPMNGTTNSCAPVVEYLGGV